MMNNHEVGLGLENRVSEVAAFITKARVYQWSDAPGDKPQRAAGSRKGRA